MLRNLKDIATVSSARRFPNHLHLICSLCNETYDEGETVVIIDVSASSEGPISFKTYAIEPPRAASGAFDPCEPRCGARTSYCSHAICYKCSPRCHGVSTHQACFENLLQMLPGLKESVDVIDLATRVRFALRTRSPWAQCWAFPLLPPRFLGGQIYLPGGRLPPELMQQIANTTGRMERRWLHIGSSIPSLNLKKEGKRLRLRQVSSWGRGTEPLSHETVVKHDVLLKFDWAGLVEICEPTAADDFGWNEHFLFCLVKAADPLQECKATFQSGKIVGVHRHTEREPLGSISVGRPRVGIQPGEGGLAANASAKPTMVFYTNPAGGVEWMDLISSKTFDHKHEGPLPILGCVSFHNIRSLNLYLNASPPTATFTGIRGAVLTHVNGSRSAVGDCWPETFVERTIDSREAIVTMGNALTTCTNCKTDTCALSLLQSRTRPATAAGSPRISGFNVGVSPYHISASSRSFGSRTCRTLAGALQLYKIRRNPLAFVHAARLGPLSATELFKWSTRKDEVNQPKDYDYTRKYDLMDLDAEYDFIDPDFMYDHPHLDKYFWASAPLSPLAIASFHNSTEGIEVILSCGAQVDLNHKFVCNHDVPWSSPAELADGMPWLIESRPKGSTLRVDSAWTALEIAVCGGSVQAVEILLPHVKKVKAAQDILERSFLSAVAHRQFSIIEVLLQEVELMPQLGREALFYCVVGHSDGADEIAEMLVDAGVTIDAQAPAPWNILHIAGIYGQFRVGKLGASDEDLGYAEERPMLPCGRCRLTRRQSDCDHGQWPSRRQLSRITDYELGNSRQQIWYFVELQEVRGERTRNAYVAETSLLKASNFDLSFLQQYWKDHRVPIRRKKTIDPKHAVAFQGHLHIDSMGMHSRISPNGVDRFGNTKQVGTV
ncbi:uncharacterized protein B0I36DRAFT_354996 [Microdochium trichocladiopsis]|uniref:Uncharacterized protein n=1 Tax=Microdochium trichocladiopsis TaxID=1682393 RepID=A0A9P8XSW4_9PEZI|nr:uncharacterized protein B0I36DRAFT_354996 [Microdochium trichocladiopsis]KAH7016140.1 hypothetical protein B0I36DRAFT_354996 [Microdochium trichocladiopsis]